MIHLCICFCACLERSESCESWEVHLKSTYCGFSLDTLVQVSGQAKVIKHTTPCNFRYHSVAQSCTLYILPSWRRRMRVTKLFPAHRHQHDAQRIRFYVLQPQREWEILTSNENLKPPWWCRGFRILLFGPISQGQAFNQCVLALAMYHIAVKIF